MAGSNTVTQEFLAIGGRHDFVSLAGGLPAADLYPVKEVEEAAGRAVARWGAAALDYGPTDGFPALRDHIVARMSAMAGRPFGQENVLITVGAMQGLELLGKVLIDPGDCIVAQFPTYVGAIDAWRMRYPTYKKLVWHAPEPAQFAAAKFIYTVPNYSNPTGVLASERDRAAVLDAASETGSWLIEDDPYRSLDLDGAQPRSILELQAARAPQGDYHGPVIYLGTLSKSIVPGLRVGWIVAPEALIRALSVAKQSSDLASSMLTHAVALELLEDGADLRNLDRILPAYRLRRDALLQAAEMRLSEWFDWVKPAGGMFVWLRARKPGLDTTALYQSALREKVAFVPSVVFDPAGQLNNALRLNFTRPAPEQIHEGIKRLARAVQGARAI